MPKKKKLNSAQIKTTAANFNSKVDDLHGDSLKAITKERKASFGYLDKSIKNMKCGTVSSMRNQWDQSNKIGKARLKQQKNKEPTPRVTFSPVPPIGRRAMFSHRKGSSHLPCNVA